MLGPPTAQIGRRIRAAEPRAPAELFRHARGRQRRPVGWTMQVDRCHLTGIGQAANEAVRSSPLQRDHSAPDEMLWS